jgi:single-strand DNA-binding protein
MRDINSVILIGRITRDAELKYISTGTGLLTFSMAVNKTKKVGDQWTDEAHFFDCRMWGKRAESLAPMLGKGKQVAVSGTLSQERWERDGQKHSRVIIDAEDVELFGGKTDAAPAQRPKAQTPARQEAHDVDEFDDDVPF